MNSALSLLRKLGLNQYESQTYYALSHNGTATAGQISSLANIPRPRVYDVLNKLEKEGFVMVQPGRPVKYKARKIDAIRDVLKQKKSDELAKDIENITILTNTISKELENNTKGLKNKESLDLSWTLYGRNNIYSKVNELIKASKKQVSIFTTAPGLSRKATALYKALKEANSNGVTIKIYSDPNAKKEHKTKLAKLAKIIDTTLTYRFMLFDKQNAILLLTPEAQGSGKEEIALWIKNPEFNQAMTNMVQKMH